MADIADGGSVEVEGSKGSIYTLKRRGSSYSCSCPAWLHQRGPESARTCKHLKAYLGEEHENRRTGANGAVGGGPAGAGSAGAGAADANPFKIAAVPGGGTVRGASGKTPPREGPVEVKARQRGSSREELLSRLKGFIERGQFEKAQQLVDSLREQFKRSEFFQQENEKFHMDQRRLGELQSQLFLAQRQQRPQIQPVAEGRFINRAQPVHHPELPREPVYSLAEKERWDKFIDGLPRTRNPDCIYDVLFLDDEFRQGGVWELLDSQYALTLVARDYLIAYNLGSALAALAKNKIIDRARLLDWSASAATRTAPNSSGHEWIGQLHDRLEPDSEERKRYAPMYCRGLSSKTWCNVRWSATKVAEVYSERLIGSDLILCHLPHLLSFADPVMGESRLNLLRAIAKQQKKNSEMLMGLALTLLKLRGPECKLGVDLVEKHGDARDLPFCRIVQERHDNLDPGEIKHRHRLKLWLDASVLAEVFQSETASAQVDCAQDVEAMLKEIENCHTDLREIAAVDDAANWALGKSNLASPPDLRSARIPRLFHEKALEPIGNINDLIFAFIRILDRKTTGDEIERVLDGVSRLCDDRPFDFKVRTARLKDRAVERLQPEKFQDVQELHHTQPFGGVSHQEDLAGLALVWTDGANLTLYNKICPRLETLLFINKSLARHTMNGLSLHSFFSARLMAVALRVLQKKSAPLLSAPTHQGGWIDARVISERLGTLARLQVEPDQFDVAQALLRLAPEYHWEAMTMLDPLDGELAAAFRFALGGKLAEQTTKPWLWAMAHRARSAEETDHRIVRRFAKMPPDTMEPAEYDLSYARPTATEFGMTIGTGTYLMPKNYTPAHPEEITMPTALFHCKPYSMFQLQFMNKRVWEPLVWPQFRESFFASEARQVLAHIDSKGRYWLDAWEPLFDPDTYTQGMARFLIIFGLAAKREECVQQAIEAMNLAVEDGRLDGEGLGEALATLVFTKQIVLSRWLAGLNEVANTSALHKLAVKRALEGSVVGLPKGSGTPPALLPRLYELVVECNEGVVNDAARQRLTSLVQNRAALKTAQALLDYRTAGASSVVQEAAMQTLQRRIDRVLRWQAYRESMLQIAEPS